MRPAATSRSPQHRKTSPRPAGGPRAPFAVDLAVFSAGPACRDRFHIELGGKPLRPPARNNRKNRPNTRPSDAGQVAARQLARGCRTTQLAGLLLALGHSQRIQILLTLLGSGANHRLLAETTRLKAGPLYHHLKELRLAGLIAPKVRDVYSVTRRGQRAILAVLALERACR